MPASWAEQACPTCGAPLPAAGREPLAEGEVDARIGEEMVIVNQKLVDAGAKNAEEALSLGCWLSLTLILAPPILAYFLSGKNWIVSVIVLLIAVVLDIALLMLLSVQAKSGAMRKAFNQVAIPELEAIQEAYHLDRARLDEIARSSLPEAAPLIAYMDDRSER